MVDIHCHVLPGVDDGAETIAESLEMLKKASEGGVKAVVATPHLLRGMYETEFSVREQMTADLQKAADEKGIDIQVKSGVEYYLSPQILEETDKLKELTINNNGKYILVELPMPIVPPGVADIIFGLKLHGITPILAHPERNSRICQNPDILFGLVEKGLITQVNSGSILGKYGREIKKCAEILLTNNLSHVIASDMHSASSDTMDKAMPLVEKLLDEKRTTRLFIENSTRILEGKSICKEEPRRPGSVKKGLKGFFSRHKKKHQNIAENSDAQE